jgi:peptidoglycan-N-acetylglucosamine deacetylase
MKLFKTPSFFKYLFPSILTKIKTEEKVIYLTFDDGPLPIYTEFVLDELAKFNAKACFFLIGANIVQNKELVNRILKEGHSIGNHTMNHPNAFEISHNIYLKEIEECQTVLNTFQKTVFFRPPYGKLKIRDFLSIKKKFKIVLWDVLVYDFANDVLPEILLEKAIENTEKGSIVVFHDNEKSFENLQYILPKYLKYWHEMGFSFASL